MTDEKHDDTPKPDFTEEICPNCGKARYCPSNSLTKLCQLYGPEDLENVLLAQIACELHRIGSTLEGGSSTARAFGDAHPSIGAGFRGSGSS